MSKRPVYVFFIVILFILITMGCTTVNKLDRYRLYGASIAGYFRTPPDPTIDSSYNVRIEDDNPLMTFISVSANLAKASQVSQADKKVRDALRYTNLPAMIWDEVFNGCVRILDGRKAVSEREADFVFEFDIVEYGIDASSDYGAVSFFMDTEASLFAAHTHELVWRRRVNVNEQMSPSVFGLGTTVVGPVVTAGILSSLSSDEILRGFEQLARETALKVSRRLEDDLYKSWYR